MWKKSIFNNIALNNNGFAYIHFPLIYKTNNLLCVELYTKAIVKFLKLTDLQDSIYCRINDSLVVELLFREINTIHNGALIKFQDINFFRTIKKQLDIIYKEIPLYIEELEKLIIQKDEIPLNLFKDIFDSFVYLLAVNNFSFIPETLLPQHLQKSYDKEEELIYIKENIFSHIKYLNSEKLKISFNLKSYNAENTSNMLSFLRNTAFLENELGDMTKFENIEYISNLLNISDINTLTPLIQANFVYPQIIYNISKDDYSNYSLIILWTKLLQVNLEFRHYWLLRFLRDLRIYYNYNFDIINNRMYNDYAKQKFKI